MARGLSTQILVVGRRFPILPFERTLAAAGIPDYLCVDSLRTADVLRADGFNPDIVIVDTELLGEQSPAALRVNNRASFVVIDHDIDDFEEVLREELSKAVSCRRVERSLRPTVLPTGPWTDQPGKIGATGSAVFG